MSHLIFLFGPALVTVVVLAALLHEYPRRPRPRTEADARALALLRSWLTPEQDREFAARGKFEVIGGDTGTRYRITCRAVMNVLQLDPTGRPVAQWCFTPVGNLATGDVLLAQKIALETMERQALAFSEPPAASCVASETMVQHG
jgi:hypothetical protein